jgi:hypothetical protein
LAVRIERQQGDAQDGEAAIAKMDHGKRPNLDLGAAEFNSLLFPAPTGREFAGSR